MKLPVIVSMPPLKGFFHPYDVQFEIMTWLLVDWALNLKKVSFFETWWQILSWKNGHLGVFYSIKPIQNHVFRLLIMGKPSIS